MMTAEMLEQRQREIEASPDLSALQQRLVERATPLLERMPIIPTAKALLSADGGICPNDGSALIFDPWSPNRHRCPRCGGEYTGERHDRSWAHHQHLWVAERIAHLATVAALAGHSDAGTRAEALLAQYGRCYLNYSNNDNVLGPARLFFSTYLESIWITNYLAGATLLREAGTLSDATAEAVSAVADEAANLIGEFDEGMSNRQTWHNAALAAIGVWFEDDELVRGAIERQSGMIAHLVHGFGADGVWYEGENYHLFALRGQLTAMGWAHSAGVDLLADTRLHAVVERALYAPTVTALPDFTFPARKDSRFGVSLAQPMYLESWEVGLARLGRQDSTLWSWLRELYQSPAPPAQRFDSYLHEAGEPAPTAPRTRADLSWWTLLEAAPSLPTATSSWAPASVLVGEQGPAILRTGGRYASLETGAYGGGHGHPDRLHLTLHADGIHWLPDFGTGSYVSRDLFWYRSTLAHNAPRLDGVSQPPGDAVCEFFEEANGWGWTRGQYQSVTRTLVTGPDYTLDVTELSGTEERSLELPWHIAGQSEVLTTGTWVPDVLASEFVSAVERLVSDSVTGEFVLQATTRKNETAASMLTARILAPGHLLRAQAPGAPTETELATFYVIRAPGRNLRCVTVLEPHTAAPTVRSLRTVGDVIEIETATGAHQHVATPEGWDITMPEGTVKLRGRREPSRPIVVPLFGDQRQPAEGVALHLAEPPALDGTLEGFAGDEPLLLDYEDQYRRSEEPYPGPEALSATAYVNWTDDALYVDVEVLKSTVVVRPPDAEPARLDNEPDDINSDGIQLYLRVTKDSPVYGFLIVPSEDDGTIRVHGVAGTAAEPEMLQGRWQRTEAGYSLAVEISVPEWSHVRFGDSVGFDLLVNRMEPDRLRRAGQLVWSGGGGWVWLRGDRQDPANFGTLELR